MGKRLFIDLSMCDACDRCTVECAYPLKAAAAEHGILSLRETAQFLLICRRCEDPACVAACRFEALERQPDGVLKRYNLRCVSCKCCSHACPFGTIVPETVPFYVSQCDFCIDNRAGDPSCVVSCAKDAVHYREIEESPEEDVYIVSDRLAVKAPKWEKQKV